MLCKLLTGVSTAAIVSMIAAGGATAQTTATPATTTVASADNGLDDIVVTARKRAENAQDVPISLTAFSGTELANQTAIKLSDIRKLTPNLIIGPAGSAPGGLVVGIRGQLQTDTLSTLDPSVGIYVDGVYWARSTGANADLLDVASAQVLKGPQGTLFGRNTTGGALVLTTENPNLQQFEGMLKGRIGNYGQRDAAVVLNVPIINDKLGLRIAANRVSSDGYERDLTSGSRLADDNTYTFRAKLLAEPTENLRILGSYEHFGFKQNQQVPKLQYASPFPGATEIVAALATGGCLKSLNPACPAAFVPGSQTFGQYINAGDYYSAYLNTVGRQRADTDTASLQAEWTLGFGTLKYIGAYRRVSGDTGVYDYDGTPFNVLQPSNYSHTHTWTHELQFNGQAINDRLDYTIGGYLFRESGFDGGSTFALPAINPNNPTVTAGDLSTRSYAAFGQATFKLTDSLSFTGGLRYSHDKKTLDLSSTSRGNCALRVGNPPVLIPAGTACLVSQARSDGAVSYLASVEYHFTPDILVYAKTSKGYRAGGFNLRGTTPTTYGPFSPENVTDYELGLKSEFFDRKVRFNVSGFYSDYTNIQRSVLVANGNGGVATTTINAAKARITGLEAELTARPVTGVMVGATLGLTDPKYKSFTSNCPAPFPTTSLSPCIGGQFDRSNERFERIPKLTYSLMASYTHAVPLGEATIRADYTHVSKTYQVGVTQTLTPALVPYITQAGYGLLNARLSWDIAKPDLQIALYGRNLTQRHYLAYQLDLVNGGLGYIFGNPGVPRQYGVEATVRF